MGRGGGREGHNYLHVQKNVLCMFALRIFVVDSASYLLLLLERLPFQGVK